LSELERRSIQRIVTFAESLGLDIPEELVSYLCGGKTTAGGLLFARLHPELDEFDPDYVDCSGSGQYGITGCECWEPVYDVDQADPCDIRGNNIPAADLPARDAMCDDCAFRPGSPERETTYHREELFALADRGEPFFCHDGMRRPIAWRHPRLGEISGDTDDWTPPIIAGVPYRANGEPALMCAGWAARRGVLAHG
jgi:hypothetical protein